MSSNWSFTPTGGSPYTLKVLADGVPRRTAGDFTVTRIPGGAVSFIDISGPNLLTIDLSVLFETGADALVVEALEGQTGVLAGSPTDIGGSAGTVPCILSTVQRMSRGVTTQGPVVLSVEFLLTAAPS